ncbi:adenylate cyclase [Pseudomonas aeruginosa]|nr:adenylate cyclase [Pseudomonas aeruginosa]
MRVDRGLGAQPGQRGALFPDRRRPFRPGRTQRLERVRRRRQYQHFLLLDEFYRSAIWLGGRTPLWWLVRRPMNGATTNTAGPCSATLHPRRRGARPRPPGAHPRPGVHRRRPLAVVQGHRFALQVAAQLLLTEAYASDTAGPLRPLRFKEQVFAGQLDLDELDPTSWSIAISNATCGNSRRRNAWNSCGAACTSRSGASSRSPAPGAEGLAAPVDGAARRGMAMGASPLGPARQPQPVEDAPGDGRASHGGQRLTYSYRLLFQIARQQALTAASTAVTWACSAAACMPPSSARQARWRTSTRGSPRISAKTS